MKPDAEISELIESLRADLPTDEDARRLRARLAALGIAAGASLTGSAAGASTLAAGATAKTAGTLLAQAGTLSWGAKLGVAAAVSASAVAGSWVWERASNTSSTAAPKALSTQVANVAPHRSAPHRIESRADSPKAPAPATGLVPPADEGLAPNPPNPPNPPKQLERSLPPTGAVHPRATVGSVEANPVASKGEALSPASTPGAELAPGDAESGSPEASSAAFSGSSGQAVATTLREETALMDGAFAALREGNRTAATAFIADHERRFPNGLLTRERERARAKLARLFGPDAR